MSKIKESALLYAEAGIPVFPCLADKSPAIAGGFKSAVTDRGKVEQLFANAAMIGVPMGKIICLDIDAKHKQGLVDDFEYCCHQLGIGDTLARLPKQLTPSGGGAHYLFIPPGGVEIRNLKLASNAKRETIIETRGKGGYICVYPSKGYSFDRGGLLSVPQISQAEIDMLFEIAGSFSEVEVKKKREPISSPWQGKNSISNKPGDDYNKRGDLPSLLRQHGWTNKTEYHWTRPGKSSGVSATLGKVESGNFYVFSSNAHPFEPETSYTPFSCYATLEHGGDYQAAAKALSAQGYGQPSQVEDVTPEMKAVIEKILQEHDKKFTGLKTELEQTKKQLDVTKSMTVAELLRQRDISNPEKLAKRKQMAKEMVYVLPGIAARGQATSIYAGPNSGKTLITLKLIRDQAEAGALGDLTVVYCNFDDDFIGANMKAEYFSEFPNVVVIDNQEQSPAEVLMLMDGSVADGTASSLCFVLDTLIRFVSDSDKGSQRAFTSLVQKFIGAQGTVIGLGHTNKHKGSDGKSIYGGTSDIRNSFSQSAMLELMTEPDTTERRVRFKNDKLRGMAKVSTCYAYTHGDHKNWIERVQTVRRVDEQETNQIHEQLVAGEELKADQPVVDYIISELKRGAQAKTDLIQNNPDASTGSKAQRAKVLDRYCEGNNKFGYEFWRKETRYNRFEYYSLIDETEEL